MFRIEDALISYYYGCGELCIFVGENYINSLCDIFGGQNLLESFVESFWRSFVRT